MRGAFVYFLYDVATKFFYIGYAYSPQRRFRQHRRTALRAKRANSFFYDNLRDRQGDFLLFGIVEYKNIDFAADGEKDYIARFRELGTPLYNKSKGGRSFASIHITSPSHAGSYNPMFGRKHSAESKKKMRESRLGVRPSEETRALMRRLKSGKNHPRYGVKHTLESCAIMSEKAKLRVRSPEHCAALSRAKMGIPARNKGVRRPGSLRWASEQRKIARANSIQAPADYL